MQDTRSFGAGFVLSTRSAGSRGATGAEPSRRTAASLVTAHVPTRNRGFSLSGPVVSKRPLAVQPVPSCRPLPIQIPTDGCDPRAPGDDGRRGEAWRPRHLDRGGPAAPRQPLCDPAEPGTPAE